MAHQGGLADIAQLLPAHCHTAKVARAAPHQHGCHRRFAAARFPHNGKQPALRKCHVHPAQHLTARFIGKAQPLTANAAPAGFY